MKKSKLCQQCCRVFVLKGAVSLIALLMSLASVQYANASMKLDQYDKKVEAHAFKLNNGESVDAELVSFNVIENRNDKGSKRITLRYVRLASTQEIHGAPIVYLAGGPGGSGISAGRGSRFAMFDKLRELGDVILFDQRGTGLSTSLPAGSGWNIPREVAATKQVYEAAAKTALSHSLRIWKDAGVDLAAYNTESNSDDLADLCNVIGAEKIRIIGISYGTHLGLSFMRRHPEKLERIVLAGVEGPNHTLKMPNDQEALLKQIQNWINEDERAKKAYPDFVATAKKVIERLSDKPHVIEKPTKTVISAFDVQYLMAAMLRGPKLFNRMPQMVYAMEQGDFSSIAAFLTELRVAELRAMGLAMDAASAATPARLKEIDSQISQTLLGDAINFPMNVIIPELSTLRLNPEFRTPVVSAVPTLAISGTGDGRTPPSNAKEILASLSNGQHLIIERAGHSDPLFLSSPKIVESIVRFFEGKPITSNRIDLPAISFQ